MPWVGNNKTEPLRSEVLDNIDRSADTTWLEVGVVKGRIMRDENSSIQIYATRHGLAKLS